VSLRYAILGYLSSGPGTGYDLARQFDTGLGWFWSARHSQIYPELRRLTDEGLVTRDQAAVSENLDKFPYTITAAGLNALNDWVESPPSYPANRDSERLQLIFSDAAPTALRAHFTAHREHYTARRAKLQETLDAIRAGSHVRINARVSNRSTPEEAAVTVALREMAYSGDIARATLEIEWAEAGLSWLDEAKVDWVPAT
jgi:DNA-binding PadR family transcriptional regulator